VGVHALTMPKVRWPSWLAASMAYKHGDPAE
jgi:hypothetical protein